jgi:hypothetical protein
MNSPRILLASITGPTKTALRVPRIRDKLTSLHLAAVVPTFVVRGTVPGVKNIDRSSGSGHSATTCTAWAAHIPSVPRTRVRTLRRIAVRAPRAPCADPTELSVEDEGTMWSIDGVVQKTETSAKALLMSVKSGAYTTARTVDNGTRDVVEHSFHYRFTDATSTLVLTSMFPDDTRCSLSDVSGTAVFHLGFTLDRLATSLQIIREKTAEGCESGGRLAAPIERDVLDARIVAVIRQGVGCYRALHPKPPGASTHPELRITILLADHASSDLTTRGDPRNDSQATRRVVEGKTVADCGPTIYLHVEPLPPLPRPPIVVEVRGSARAHATAKDSAWVKHRQVGYPVRVFCHLRCNTFVV